MSEHERIADELSIDVFFCDPRSPWQRGSNENTNRLLRQYLPRQMDFSRPSQVEPDRIAQKINTRPRRVLDWDTSQDRLEDLLEQLTHTDQPPPAANALPFHQQGGALIG